MSPKPIRRSYASLSKSNSEKSSAKSSGLAARLIAAMVIPAHWISTLLFSAVEVAQLRAAKRAASLQNRRASRAAETEQMRTARLEKPPDRGCGTPDTEGATGACAPRCTSLKTGGYTALFPILTRNRHFQQRRAHFTDLRRCCFSSARCQCCP